MQFNITPNNLHTSASYPNLPHLILSFHHPNLTTHIFRFFVDALSIIIFKNGDQRFYECNSITTTLRNHNRIAEIIPLELTFSFHFGRNEPYLCGIFSHVEFNFNTRVDLDAGDLLQFLGGANEINHSLENSHFPLVIGVCSC